MAILNESNMKKKQHQEPKICHDCGCEEGQIHMHGCDMEYCPFCGGQLISCMCCYSMLGYSYDWGAPNCGLPEEVYKHGLSDEETDKWLDMLDEKGRVPYIRWPNLCTYCGKLWPDMFRVPDEEWKKYIRMDHQNDMICIDCWNHIKSVIDISEGCGVKEI